MGVLAEALCWVSVAPKAVRLNTFQGWEVAGAARIGALKSVSWAALEVELAAEKQRQTAGGLLLLEVCSELRLESAVPVLDVPNALGTGVALRGSGMEKDRV